MGILNERNIGYQIRMHGGFVSWHRWNLLRLRTVILAEAEDVVTLPNCSALMAIDLRGLSIGDAEVSPLLAGKSLIGIFLSNTRVSDRLVDDLLKTRQLQFLGIDKTAFSVDVVTELRRRLPNCYIYFDDDEKRLESVLADAGLDLELARRTFAG